MSATALEKARKIDEISKGAMALFEQAGSFEAELQVAQAMNDLQVALTDDLMQPVMKLMNTDLGFRTDRDPVITPKDKENNPMTPYSVAVVRNVVIEAKLRGFHVVGNEFNIITGRFYACRNGLKRKCEKWPGVTDLKINLGVPKLVGDKGALVPVTATWRKDGTADKIEAEIPVRVNSGMGADAILGKAERKIYKRVHDRLGGITTPDGEAGDDIEIQAASVKPSPQFANAKTAEVVIPKQEAASNGATSAGGTSPSTQSTSQAAPSTAGGAPSPGDPRYPSLVEKELKPQEQLGEIVTGAGFTFDHFVKWARNSAQLTPAECDRITSFNDLKETDAAKFIRAQKGLLSQLNAAK